MAVVLCVVGGISAVGYAVWSERSLPIYEMGSEEPVGGYAVNTLVHGDSSYVSGEFEFSLIVTNDSWGFGWLQRIGKTPDDGMYVYKLSGQDGSDWLYAEGEMTGETVFRNQLLAPITLDTLDVTSLEFSDYTMSSTPTIRRTSDQGIIREVIARLGTNGAAQPASSSPSRVSHLDLWSPQLPGMTYLAYVIVDDRGSVYLAERGQEGTIWIPAGDRFSQWVRSGASRQG